MRKCWIGTSGYSYKDWRDGVFYPAGLPSGRWFEYYAERFPTVELNVTFYRLPPPAIFKSWRRRAPEGFLFVKGSRYITHLKRLKDPKPSLERFWKSVSPLEEKLAGILWQLPPGFHADLARLDGFLEALETFPRTRHVFEFREEDWFVPAVTELLRRKGMALCRADGRHGREEVPDTAPFIYIRRHGPAIDQPYHHDYPASAIRRDAADIRACLRQGKEVFMYYNNDTNGAALRNAVSLRQRVEASPGPARASRRRLVRV